MGLERCEPLTVRDEYSRYLLELRALENARSETVQKSFERLFEQYGLPAAMRSDNGSPFASRSAVHGLSRLSAWWVASELLIRTCKTVGGSGNGMSRFFHRGGVIFWRDFGNADGCHKCSCQYFRKG